jgi:hypothetical protein
MAAPNIVNVANITGVSTFVSIGNTNTYNLLLSNPASSNSVYKVNTIIASNIDGSNNVDVTVSLFSQAVGAGTSTPLVYTTTVPAKGTLIVLGKDTPIYLEENRSISALASNANRCAIICSYESIQ